MTAVGVLGPLLANVMSFRGDLAEAIAHARRALDLAEAAGDRQMELLAHVQLTLCHSYSGVAVAAVAHEDSVAACAAEMCSSTAHTWRPYVGGERRAERGDPDAARHLHAAQRTRRPRERHSRSVGSPERAARAGSGGAGARSARGQAVEAEEVVGDVEHVDAGEPGTRGVAMSSPGAVNVSATRSSITITVPCSPASARIAARTATGSGRWVPRPCPRRPWVGSLPSRCWCGGSTRSTGRRAGPYAVPPSRGRDDHRLAARGRGLLGTRQRPGDRTARPRVGVAHAARDAASR